MENNPTDKQPAVFGIISARIINALIPLIREVYDYRHSMLAFHFPSPNLELETYLIPHDTGGTQVVVTDGIRLMAIRDPEGSVVVDRTPAALQIHFPDGMLDILERKYIILHNDHGDPFEVLTEPYTGQIICHTGFGLVMPTPEQTERFKGSFGTWFNGDSKNVTALDTWRAEPASPGLLQELTDLLAQSSMDAPISTESLYLDTSKLSAIAYAAQRLDIEVLVQFFGPDRFIRILRRETGPGIRGARS